MREDAFHELAGGALSAAAPLGGLSELAVRARGGDDEAFEALVQATQRRVSGLAWRLLGNAEDARDATQEVYLRVHRFLKGYRAGDEFHPWLYRIAVNVCRDQARRRRPTVPLAEEEADRAAPDDSERRAVDSQRSALLRRALATLPEKERFALVMRDLEGLATEDVARALGSTPTTVRSQISSARKRVRAFFEELPEGRPA